MRRAGRLLATALAALVVAGAGIADPAKAAFRRGATFVEFFNFSASTGTGAAKTYADPAFPHALEKLKEFDYDELRRMGFDHMRVPIDLGPMMRGDERQRDEIIAQLKTVIATLRQHGLGVLVTLYPPSLQQELPETYLDGLKGRKFRLYFDMAMRITKVVADLKDDGIGLEPMNEPQSECRAKVGLDWTEYQKYMVGRIRSVAPDMPLFITGGCWSNIEGIVLLDSDLIRDRRNYISVHFYYPFLFTHQSATWTTPYLAGTLGVPYPASAGDEQTTLAMTRERFKTVPLKPSVDREAALRKAEGAIRQYFSEQQGVPAMEEWMQRIADWQTRQNVPNDRIVFTEFGAMKQLVEGVEIDKTSRVRWLHDASSIIERHGWGWNVYVLRDDPFGIYDRESDPRPDPALLRALRLKVLEEPAERR